MKCFETIFYLLYRFYGRKLVITVGRDLHCILGSKERKLFVNPSNIGDKQQIAFKKNSDAIEMKYSVIAANRSWIFMPIFF